MNLQPTTFIGSQISEFKDLRNALKYVLSKSGYRVLMSESNDFGVASSVDSLDSCKSQIEKSNFYLLIIGNEKGTEVILKSGEKSSVTKEEFKHFVSIDKQLAPKLILFVKKETWENYKLDNRSGISDAFQLDFIREVVESDKENKVLGKWAYRFENFEDIITIIETNQNGLFLEETRKQVLFKIYLKKEITNLLKEFLEKGDDTEVRTLLEVIEFPEIESGDMFQNIKLSQKDAVRISTFILCLETKKQILPAINRIFSYIIQGEFAFYNSHDLKYSPPNFIKQTTQCLEMLEKNIFILNDSSYYNEIKNKLNKTETINSFEYRILKSLHASTGLVISKLISLVYFFNSNQKDLPKMNDAFYDYRGAPVKDLISEADVQKYVNEYFQKLTVNKGNNVVD